mgnify:CR=1 FL=1
MKDKLDLVLFHNGITAKLYVSYTVGLSSQSKSTEDADRPTRDRDQTVDTSDKVEKEWTIHDKLEKKDSKYRINLI